MEGLMYTVDGVSLPVFVPNMKHDVDEVSNALNRIVEGSQSYVNTRIIKRLLLGGARLTTTVQV